MEPEKLKVIAEGMGYEVAIKPRNINGTVEDAVFSFHGEVWYDPIINNDQMVEIMEKLKVGVNYDFYRDVFLSYIYDDFGVILLSKNEGKTINEAVCNAAYEYFK